MRLLGRKLTLEQLRLLADGTKVYVDEGEQDYGFESGVSIKKDNKITDSKGEYYALDKSHSIKSGEVKVYEVAETNEMDLITFEQASELEDGTVVFADDESKSLSGVYIKKGGRINNPYGTNGYILTNRQGNDYCGREVKLYIKKQEEKHMLKIGDRVKVLDSVLHIIGKVGTVVDVTSYVSVEFDEHIDGHSASGRGRYGYCWNLAEERLELVKETKVDYSVGDRVKALVAVGSNYVKNATGVVVMVDGGDYEQNILVKFDTEINGHHEDNRCWWMDEDGIELIKEVQKPSYNTPLKTKACFEKHGFSIGDRIKVVEDGDLKGEIGTVIDFWCDSIGIAFDKPVGMHTCGLGDNRNSCVFGHGQWFKPHKIELISCVRGLRATTPIFDEPIVPPVNDVEITVKGRKITASYKGFVGVARCNPEDDFNESYGTGLALERLGAEIKAQGEKEIKEIEESKIPTLDINSYREFLDGKVGVKFKSFDDMKEFLKKLDGIVKWKDGENANGYVPRILTNLIYVHKDFKVLLNDREEYCKERFNLKVVKYK